MRRTSVLVTLALTVTGLGVAPATAAVTPDRAAAAAQGPGATGATRGTGPAGTPELTTTTRLADRRSLVVGSRLWEMGAEDGSYPATGFHTQGEMGGFWSPPIKLLDGLWFRLDGSPLSAGSYASGWGYQRMDLGSHDGVHVTRTDVAPSGLRAGLVGLRFSASSATTVHLDLDAHSELMKAYPWGTTTPDQSTYNLPDTGRVAGRSLLFREDGTPPVAHAEVHHYAALVGSRLRPTASRLGPDFRGPGSADSSFGKGTGGRLSYDVKVPAGTRTVWFTVAGSDRGVAAAQAARRTALRHPARLLRAVVAHRRAVAANTRVRLPGDRLLQRSVSWSKQDIAESVQEARHLQVRVSHAGTKYPAPKGTVAKARWIGAGFPDYPWLFGTDGEYTAFAAVASGQFRAIEDHLRALRDVSEVANGNSGKVVHEVTPDGQVYFGANGDAGNTDETAKFPSIVALVWRWTGDDRFRDEMYAFARRNMHYIFRTLDADGDGWPEGLGNVERPGMGEEKLDNTVYTIRGLRDLADLAASKGDTATRRWAATRATRLERRFEKAWWNGQGTKAYADSLDDPGNKKVYQRHWIGLTPIEAELHRPGRVDGPLASLSHARTAVAQRETTCFTGTYGLFHTGTGATSDPAGNKGATCDPATSSTTADREVFTLTTSIMAVAEAALGRPQLRRYADDLATVQLDPSVEELPGAMPEISPSPDFGANIDKPYTERSMALQAWGTYGVLWPVVHFELGVSPGIGRHRVTVVPQVPAGQRVVAARHVRLGAAAVDVRAVRAGHRLVTVVRQHRSWRLRIGAVLPTGARVRSVRVDGHRASYDVVRSARGREVVAAGGAQRGVTRLVVHLRRPAAK